MMHVKLKYKGTTMPVKIYEVREERVEGLLATGEWDLVDENFKEVKEVEKSFFDSLVDLNGVGVKTAQKIIDNYPTKELLFNANHKNLYDLLDDNDVELLIEKGMIKK